VVVAGIMFVKASGESCLRDPFGDDAVLHAVGISVERWYC